MDIFYKYSNKNEKIKKYKSKSLCITEQTCISNYTQKITHDIIYKNVNERSRKYYGGYYCILPNSIKHMTQENSYGVRYYFVPNSIKIIHTREVKSKSFFHNLHKIISYKTNNDFDDDIIKLTNIISIYKICIYLSKKKHSSYFLISNIHSIYLRIIQNGIRNYINNFKNKLIFLKNSHTLCVCSKGSMDKIYNLTIFKHVHSLSLHYGYCYKLILDNVHTLTLLTFQLVLSFGKNANTINLVTFNREFGEQNLYNIRNVWKVTVSYRDYTKLHLNKYSAVREFTEHFVQDISMLSNVRKLYFYDKSNNLKINNIDMAKISNVVKMPNLNYIDETNLFKPPKIFSYFVYIIFLINTNKHK